MLRLMVRAIVTTWTKERARQRRLQRATELILRSHLLVRDRQIKILKRQLAETRELCIAAQQDAAKARQATAELVWARCRAAGLEQLKEVAAARAA